MRVGGYAQNDGICFVGDRYRIRMTMKRDGDFTLRLRKNWLSRSRFSRKLKNPFERIPFLRGVFRIMGGNYLMMLFAALLLLGELTGFFDDADILSLNVNVARAVDDVIAACSLALLAFLAGKALWRPKRTFQFHGAEHKTINAYQAGRMSQDGVRQSSRIARRCGTQMVVFLMPLMLLLSLVIDSAAVCMFLSFAVAYEIFNWKKSDKLPVLSWFFKLGYFIQKHLVTREPTDEQMKAALTALFALLEAERTGTGIQQPKDTLKVDLPKPDRKGE